MAVLAVVLVGFGFAGVGVSREAVTYGVLVAGCGVAVALVWRWFRGRAGRVPEPEARPAEQAAQVPARPVVAGLTDTEVLQRVLAQTRQAVGFRPVFPPQHPMKRRTFFGGRPFGPPDLAWPGYDGDEGRKAALFMGQVAVADLPDIPEVRTIPGDTVLYFFAPLFNQEDARGMVVAASGDPSGWREIAPPENASDLGPLSFMQSWSTRSGRAMMTFPKWEMEPAGVDSFPDDIPVPGIHRDPERYKRLSAK